MAMTHSYPLSLVDAIILIQLAHRAYASVAAAGGVATTNDLPSLPSTMPDSVAESAKLSYRSGGLGVYAVIVRFATMPLEKVAMVINSSQVRGSNQLSQAWRIAFSDGPLTPFKTVGRASIIAWFFQYSVMGFVVRPRASLSFRRTSRPSATLSMPTLSECFPFLHARMPSTLAQFQCCDRALSKGLDAPMIPYGPELMKPPRVSYRPEFADSATTSGGIIGSAKIAGKAVLAPLLAGSIESAVANRAEAQRFYGPDKLAQIEQKLGWGALRRQCGPGFTANASRNFVMSATSFVVTPTLYKSYFPQEKKSQTSLFW